MRAKKERTRSARAAVLITAAVVVASAFLGCNRSLNALRRETAHTLSFPADGGEYSIATDGKDMAATARNLMTLARKYLPDGEEDYATLEACCRQMDQIYFEASDVRTAAVGIRTACRDLTARLEVAPGLSQRDRDYLAGFSASLDGCLHRMANDPYNAAAEEFNRTLDAFPANVLGIFVEPLQTVTFEEGGV